MRRFHTGDKRSADRYENGEKETLSVGDASLLITAIVLSPKKNNP